jgi:hypothetical protein
VQPRIGDLWLLGFSDRTVHLGGVITYRVRYVRGYNLVCGYKLHTPSAIVKIGCWLVAVQAGGHQEADGDDVLWG